MTTSELETHILFLSVKRRTSVKLLQNDLERGREKQRKFDGVNTAGCDEMTDGVMTYVLSQYVTG